VSLPNEVAKEVGRLPFGHRSGGPSDLSRCASQPKALLTIAGALADLRGLAIGMAAAFAVLGLMRVTL
jgi:hypothetical protein